MVMGRHGKRARACSERVGGKLAPFAPRERLTGFTETTGVGALMATSVVAMPDSNLATNRRLL